MGKSLTKAILKFNPHSIRIFSRDEVKHHLMQEEFANYPGAEKIRHLLGDVRDLERINKAMHGVDIAIHAAALKRLDLLEYNVEESIKTNILGAMNFVKACLNNEVEKAVFVSTDKACSPINTYGACKFVSERIFIESNYNKGSAKTALTCVRYGNVVESTGSVIPFFEEKIKNKKTIPLTHPEMTRFFITPDQAVELILTAIKNCVGGEVFIPKLPAFKIVDLIEILQERQKSNSDVKIIGVRPGEKIHEYMLNDSEVRRTYEFDNYFILTSEIAKYSAEASMPGYLKTGKKLNADKFKGYSSQQQIMGKDRLKVLLADYYNCL